MLKEGKILQDRYRVEKQIGQGGMGSVYLATDERFNSTVAIKETLFTDDNFRKAFSREARLLNSLKHTALPKVSDTFIEGNGQYIVMEYIAGDDLFEMLEKSGEAFPLSDVLIWAEQLLDALEYLHGQEVPIIHRDIKPQNLKLTPQGQIILLDFGLAKGNPTDANHQTAANSIFGYSRNYASLEQIQGTGTDPRSDIYSLAATLYHLLTGKPPADALTRVMMVLNEETDPLQSADLIHEQVSEDLANNLQEAMSLNANLRPQSAVEMRELLSGKRKRIVTTKPNTAPNKAAGTNLYTQNTKVFTDGEESKNNSKQSDIKTEVLPLGAVAGDSVKTKIGKPQTLSNKKGSTQNPVVLKQSSFANKNLFAASAVGILLLVGSVASMIYLWSPSADFTDDLEKQAVENSLANVSNVEPVNTDADGDLDNSNLFTESDKLENDYPDENMPEQNIADAKKESVESVDRSKGERSDKKEVVKTDEKTKELKEKSEDKVIISNGLIKTKDAVISEKGIKTKDVVIDNKGVKVLIPKTAKVPPNSPITQEQYDSLSPEQQKKIRDAMEMKRRLEDKKRRDRRLRNKRRPPPPRPRPRP